MNIQEVISTYSVTVEKQESIIRVLNTKILHISILRFLVVIVACALSYLLWQNTIAVTITLSVCVLLFLILLKYHEKLFRAKKYSETKLQYLVNELKGMEYDFSSFDGADEKTDPKHRFASDLDLFGKNSFFQSINRTVTSFGTDKLANIFLNPLENKKEILQQQQAVKELKDKYESVLNFIIEGRLTGQDRLNTKKITESFADISSLSLNKRKFWNIATYIVPLLYLIMGVLIVCDVISSVYFGALWTATFILSIVPSKRVQYLAQIFEKKTNVLKKYAILFKIPENEQFVSAELNELKKILNSDNTSASKAINKLKYYYDCLGLSFTFPIILIFNPVLMWNIKYAIKIERWIEQYEKQIEPWFAALAKFDATASLAIFAHNHPEYTYPCIAEQYMFKAKALGHPLLHRNICVKNDVDMEKRPFFLVITGANMAGKSTYLRTIGINHILACVGAPVCAEELTIFPAKLVTNLRTTDSLNDNESYFFAELKRLKMIIDCLNAGETLLIILDEILKGTNSEDKQKGSLALIKQLITMNSNGIIATHDLVLGTLEKEFPEHIKNYCFEATIQDNRLIFSYKIMEGIAQNMNATFLMRRMGIVL
ncbi:MAG: hypothetical protein LBR10_10395 [Prevotellaceae bacterium]|jgi:hypothetical protein|nr:hypothetical protein [Prevotellaceae bacterium]